MHHREQGDFTLLRRRPRPTRAPPAAEWSGKDVMKITERANAGHRGRSGRARGGGSEFLLSLDLRFGARGHCILGQPEVAIGIIPGGTGTQRLPGLMGRSRALEVVLGCEDFDAELHKYVAIEAQIQKIAPVHNIGALSLETAPLKYSLRSEAHAWKALFGNKVRALSPP